MVPDFEKISMPAIVTVLAKMTGQIMIYAKQAYNNFMFTSVHRILATDAPKTKAKNV